MSRLVISTAVALFALAVGGCGSQSNSGSTPSGTNTATSGPAGGAASREAVAWADKVCQSVESEVATLTKEPNIDTSNPQAARDGLIAFLDDFGTALDRLVGGIKGAGAPPVTDGKQVVDKTTQQLDQAKTTVQNAKTKLQQVSVSDPAALKQAFTEVGQELTNLGSLDSTKTMEDNPQLEDAFKKAETCRKLNQQKKSSSPSTPTS